MKNSCRQPEDPSTRRLLTASRGGFRGLTVHAHLLGLHAKLIYSQLGMKELANALHAVHCVTADG
jgi:hypothetical protein